MKVLYWIFLIILFIGGANWALFSWLDLNLVAKIFPDVVNTVVISGADTTTTTMNVIAKIVYSLVGLSALWILIANLVGCKCCEK